MMILTIFRVQEQWNLCLIHKENVKLNKMLAYLKIQVKYNGLNLKLLNEFFPMLPDPYSMFFNILLIFPVVSPFVGIASQTSKLNKDPIKPNLPVQLDTQNGKSPLSSEITPHTRMEPPNCSSTPFRTPRSVRRGRRSNLLFGSPALSHQSTEDRILGT